MKRHRAPSDSRPPSNRLPPQDRPRTSAGTSVSKAKTVTSDGMAWKRIFSFRASATQDRPRALSPDSLAVSPPDQPPPVAAATADAASMAASTTNTSLSSRIEEQSLSDGTIPDRSDQPDAGPSEASSDGQSSRPRSLDLSERLQARASYSAESLLLFNHPEGSRSTLSLPYTYRSMHERRLRSPVTVATTSKSVDTLPRPPPKARPKRRDYASYPYFVTPLAFATMNPYIVPATPPSSPQNTKPEETPAVLPNLASIETTSTRDTPPRGVSSEDAPTSPEPQPPSPPPTLIFKKITSRGRLRPSTDELATSSKAAIATPVRRHSEDHPRPTAAHHRTDSHAPVGLAVPRAVPAQPAATLQSSAAAEREREQKLQIAVTKVRLDSKEVREERDVGDVLPKLRMLRAR